MITGTFVVWKTESVALALSGLNVIIIGLIMLALMCVLYMFDYYEILLLIFGL